MTAAVARRLDAFLDLIYPPRCLICDAWDTPSVCESCADAFWPPTEPLCARCGRTQEGSVCRTCADATAAWGDWAFDSARAAAIHLGPLRHAIHRFKYRGVERLALPLGAFLANRALADGLLADRDTLALILPMPSSPKRERRRGYNPARLLALPLAEMLGAPLASPEMVVRGRVRRAQMGLAPDARRRNVNAGAFTVVQPEAVSGRRVLIVDDVFTTGATAQGLARALVEVGAARVDVLTLAGGG